MCFLYWYPFDVEMFQIHLDRKKNKKTPFYTHAYLNYFYVLIIIWLSHKHLTITIINGSTQCRIECDQVASGQRIERKQAPTQHSLGYDSHSTVPIPHTLSELSPSFDSDRLVVRHVNCRMHDKLFLA